MRPKAMKSTHLTPETATTVYRFYAQAVLSSSDSAKTADRIARDMVDLESAFFFERRTEQIAELVCLQTREAVQAMLDSIKFGNTDGTKELSAIVLSWDKGEFQTDLDRYEPDGTIRCHLSLAPGLDLGERKWEVSDAICQAAKIDKATECFGSWEFSIDAPANIPMEVAA